MNKQTSLILILSAGASLGLAACGGSSSDSSLSSSSDEPLSQSSVLSALLGDVKITCTGSLKRSFPTDYSYLDTLTPISAEYDFGLYSDEEGDSNSAVRVYDGSSSTTYYRSGDGYALLEYLKPDNTVSREKALYRNSEIIYNEVFMNPFSYVDASDIGEDYSFDLAKASFLVERLTGYTRPASSAVFRTSGSVAVGLTLAYEDAMEIYTSGASSDSDDYIEGLEVTNSFAMDVAFSYDVLPISEIEPRSEGDAALAGALIEEENFTATFSSDATTSTSIVYVTKDAIYSHYGINKVGPSDNDYYYKKNADGTYTSYFYSTSAGAWSAPESLTAKRSDLLFDPASISADIFLKESGNVFYLDSLSAPYGAASLVLPQYPVDDGYGISAQLTLKDGHLSSYQASFYPSSVYSIAESFYDYGTTALPEWLDTGIFA